MLLIRPTSSGVNWISCGPRDRAKDCAPVDDEIDIEPSEVGGILRACEQSQEMERRVVKVKLQDVVQTLDGLVEEIIAHLNKRTGELMTLSTEEFEAVEEGEDLADYPEWQHELILKAKEIMDSPDWIELPVKEDIDDYAIMEEFCYSIADPKLSEKLLSAIRGRGAYSRFRGEIDDLDLEQEWYDFRAAELEKIAVDWLKANRIAYTRETDSGIDVN